MPVKQGYPDMEVGTAAQRFLSLEKQHTNRELLEIFRKEPARIGSFLLVFFFDHHENILIFLFHEELFACIFLQVVAVGGKFLVIGWNPSGFAPGSIPGRLPAA